MQIENITTNTAYRAVAEPFGRISKKLSEIDQRLLEIHNELCRTASGSDDAWDRYLNSEDATEQRAALRAESEKLSNRKSLLKAALERGRQEVDSAQARLSRDPCKQARPRYVEQIRRILAAQDEMTSACIELRRIRDELEAAGYRSGALPTGEISTDSFGSYRSYIKSTFPEIGELNKSR